MRSFDRVVPRYLYWVLLMENFITSTVQAAQDGKGVYTVGALIGRVKVGADAFFPGRCYPGAKLNVVLCAAISY